VSNTQVHCHVQVPNVDSIWVPGDAWLHRGPQPRGFATMHK
jgi:hypothetical protein